MSGAAIARLVVLSSCLSSPSLQSIRETFSSLKGLSDDRRERIQNGIAAQQKLDNLRLEFAKRAAVSHQCHQLESSFLVVPIFSFSCRNSTTGWTTPLMTSRRPSAAPRSQTWRSYRLTLKSSRRMKRVPPARNFLGELLTDIPEVDMCSLGTELQPTTGRTRYEVTGGEIGTN